MGVEIIFKIAGIGILTAVIGQVLKQTGKDEIATLTTLAGLIIVLIMVLDLITNLFDNIRSIFKWQTIRKALQCLSTHNNYFTCGSLTEKLLIRRNFH